MITLSFGQFQAIFVSQLHAKCIYLSLQLPIYAFGDIHVQISFPKANILLSWMNLLNNFWTLQTGGDPHLERTCRIGSQAQKSGLKFNSNSSYGLKTWYKQCIFQFSCEENLTEVAHITTVEHDLLEELTFVIGVVQNAPVTPTRYNLQMFLSRAHLKKVSSESNWCHFLVCIAILLTRYLCWGLGILVFVCRVFTVIFKQFTVIKATRHSGIFTLFDSGIMNIE